MNRGDVKLIIDRCIAHDVPDAADLIERQAAQIEQMREAISLFIEQYPHMTKGYLLDALSTTPQPSL